MTELRAAGCVFAEEEAVLLTEAAATADDLAGMLARRIAGEPLEHVVGWAAFLGLRIAVAPGVFVPRRRTEFLAREVIAATAPGAVVLDLCCGTGALAAAVVAAVDDVEVHASDVDPAAIGCARRNLAGSRGQVHGGDLFAALPSRLRGRIDVLVANVPYVPTDAIGHLPAEARLHERRDALDGGADGLDVLRRVAARAPAWLAPGGRLLCETSATQAPGAVVILEAAGLRTRVSRSEAEDATVVTGAHAPGRGWLRSG